MRKIFFILFLFSYGEIRGQVSGSDKKINNANLFETKEIPVQPDKSSWLFVKDLKTPLWTKLIWSNKNPDPEQADLREGISLKTGFPDPQKRLQVAYNDIHDFFEAGGIKNDRGKYIIETMMDSSLNEEAFRLEVMSHSARISSGDTEGIRRGLFYLEDEILRLEGPFLPLGTIQSQPFIKRRINRCFFSPIKRPGNQPGYGDELMDEVDYYPNEYLNRLAHEGVNGLWLTISSKDGNGNSIGFGDLVSTEVTPNAGIDGEKRLAKLQQIVDKCLNYGIRIYIKTMEPHVRFDENDSRLKQYPDLVGGRRGNYYYLCASGTAGQQYLYEATNKIFKAVPELGGIINISHGELYTTCLSALPATGGGQINCPRCSKMAPWQILHKSLSAMQKGMTDAAPEAELISWLYMPQPQSQSENSIDTLASWVYEIPANTPKGVILQFNFESGVTKDVFEKKLIGGDYWISTPGPSSRFDRIARTAKKNNTPVSAKIQTGTSYSVATVPYVPVPSLLYRKFYAMKELGVSHTMLNWIVGAAPGLMNKAAGLLSFQPFPESEDAFLHRLASLYWKKKDVEKIKTAWKYFSNSYENYPLTNLFQYYGPMNDGPVWPLLLKPKDAILSPTYQLGSRKTLLTWPPSGDRIGESFTNILTLNEMVELCKHMSESWDQGLHILNDISKDYSNNQERLLDVGIAQALGIQFRSGYNILRFYLLREEMFRMDGLERFELLKQLEVIINEEMELSERLILLCQRDPRLGFHPDAEGYKYFPKKLRWRINQLEHVLNNDLPQLKKMIFDGEPLFPEYTGRKPSGPLAYALPSETFIEPNNWQPCSSGVKGKRIWWGANYDSDTLYITILDSLIGDHPSLYSPIDQIQIKIEPKRLWPSKNIEFKLRNRKDIKGISVTKDESGLWRTKIRIPFKYIGVDSASPTPLRINVNIYVGQDGVYSWIPSNPISHRLLLGSDNSADLGWLVFKKN